MSIERHIYWRDDIAVNEKGERFANVHILIGYNKGTISDFLEMGDMIREMFPQACDDEISCGTVFRSSRYCGFSIVAWKRHLPADDYSGWTQHRPGDSPEYGW